MTRLKKENRIAGIYKIINNINNKVYIGESLDIYERWDKHKEDLNNNTHHSFKLQQDYNIYGKEHFNFEIIEQISNDFYLIVQQCILLIYEDKYIKEYDSVENGYNLEYTLEKVLNKEKSMFNDVLISDKNINTLITIKKHIEKTGTYKKLYNKSNTLTKNQKPRNNNKENEYKHDIVNNITFPSTVKNTVCHILTNGYKLKCPYNTIFKNLRELNIFYYNDDKRNLPNKKYLNTYFLTEIITYDNGNTLETILVTEDGYDFLKNLLLDNNIIIKLLK
jgi:group I intron endonuclease